MGNVSLFSVHVAHCQKNKTELIQQEKYNGVVLSAASFCRGRHSELTGMKACFKPDTLSDPTWDQTCSIGIIRY